MGEADKKRIEEMLENAVRSDIAESVRLAARTLLALDDTDANPYRQHAVAHSVLTLCADAMHKVADELAKGMHEVADELAKAVE